MLDALGRLDVEERAARQALARTSAEGLLVSERHGRRTAWALTERGRELLTEGTARIYGFMREPHAWDGPLARADRRRSRRPSASCATGCAPS